MAWQGQKQFGLSFDKCNTLFLLIVVGAIIGGKIFLIFENFSYYTSNPSMLLSGSGFVFYGSLLTCIPLMLWFFKRNKVPFWAMLDLMAIVTCILHACGRIGCFMAGCCYGLPTDSFFGVIFINPVCQAEPLNTSLHPTQLYEAAYIFTLLIILVFLKNKRQFEGQLFLVYLVLYATGRAVIELFRGDIQRGFIIQDYLSNSQFISLLIIAGATYFYVRLRNTKLDASKNTEHGK